MARETLEFGPAIGVGISDLQHATRAEVQRILRETKGDEVAQSKLLLAGPHELDLLSDEEVDVVARLSEVGFEAGAGKRSAEEGYLESRELYNSLLLSGRTGPVALVMASSAVGSYSISENPNGSGGVVFKKASSSWEDRGRAAESSLAASGASAARRSARPSAASSAKPSMTARSNRRRARPCVFC